MHTTKSFETATLPLLDRLYRIALCLVPDQAAAERCLEQTYSQSLRLFHHLAEGDNVRLWMFHQLFSVIHRQPKRWLDRWFRPSDSVSGHQDEIARSLQNIPTELREVVLLADIEGFHKSEIAAILEIGEETAAERLADGRSRLRAAVAEPRSWAPAILKSSEAL